MAEKLLVIGAGPGQIHVIKAGKKLGYHVTVVSVPGDYPGFKVADEILYEDIFNTDAIIEYAKKHGIQGVVSDQSDMAAPLVGKVAEALGLPTWGSETAVKFTDKVRMRDVFEELGLPVPAYFHATTLEEAQKGITKIGYPVVIKPTDAFASRGVFKVYNEKELTDYFPRSLDASRSKNIIVEQFLQGEQYFCQGFVQEHKLRLYAFSDRYYYDLPDVAIPYTNAFPAKITQEFQDRMTEMFTKVVDYLHPMFGHVWAEWIYNKETDKLYIIEIAIRGGGAFVTDELIPRAYGIDSQPYLVNAAMGHNEKKFIDEIITPRSAAFFSFLLPEGNITKIEGVEAVNDISGVVKTDYKKMAVGDVVPPIENKGSRYGMVIVEGRDRDELDSIMAVVKKTLTIEVETKDGTKGIIWD